MGRACGLVSHQWWTSHQWNSSYGPTLKPWCTHCWMILKRIWLPVLLRQQQPSHKNLAFLSAHVSLCCVAVSCVLKSVATCLNTCSKLVKKHNFYFRISQWFSLISNLSQNHSEGPWHCKDACPTYSCLKISLCLVPLITSQSLSMELFCALHMNCIHSIHTFL